MEYWISKAIGRSMRPQGAPTNLECANVPKDYSEHLFKISWIKIINWGHAKDLFNNSFDEYWNKIIYSPGKIPPRGSVICWNQNMGGGFGHIAVVLEADAYSFTVIEQDGFKNVLAYQKSYQSYANVIGWLLPKLPSQINKPIGGDMEKKLNDGDKYNIIKVTENSPEEVKSKGDWNNVYYSVIQPCIVVLRGKIKEIDSDLKKSESQVKKLNDRIRDLEATNPDPVYVEFGKVMRRVINKEMA
jgi:hypothetical protein